MADRDQTLYNLFLEEVGEQLEEMEETLITLERNKKDEDVINQLFRIIHTIKGSAGTLKVDSMTLLSHSFENLLSKLRANQFEVDDEIISILFEAVDCIRDVFYCVSYNQEIPEENVQIINKHIEDSIYTRENNISKGNSNSNKREENTYKIKISPREGLENKNIIFQLLLDFLEEEGRVLSIEPENFMDFGDSLNNSVEITVLTPKTVASMEQELSYLKEDDNKVEITSLEQSDKEISSEEKKISPGNNNNLVKEEKTSIRVDAEKIDKIINVVGEFVIDKETMNQLIRELRIKYKGDPIVSELNHTIAHVNSLSYELQEKVMAVRMLPLENIFNKFPRIVRDLAIKCNKKVSLKLEGQETEIDRGIMQELIDPLTHIIRNSIDHGIEPAEERIKLGKNQEGTINLKAKYSEGNVLIEIADDGAGLNIDRIKEKAINSQLASEQDLSFMSEDEIRQFVFLPGFSTMETISEISGRGVGLDIVKANIKRLNGSIDIKSKSGEGTTFSIRLPLTIEIIQALMINEDEYKFAIPIASVTEIIKLKKDEVRERVQIINSVEVFEWRGQYIPVIRIGRYFNIPGSHASEYYGNDKKLIIVVVGYGERKIAMVASRLQGTREIVIKPMSEFIGENKLLGNVGGISGESILGDGSFAHIMDVDFIGENWKRIIKQNRKIP